MSDLVGNSEDRFSEDRFSNDTVLISLILIQNVGLPWLIEYFMVNMLSNFEFFYIKCIFVPVIVRRCFILALSRENLFLT